MQVMKLFVFHFFVSGKQGQTYAVAYGQTWPQQLIKFS